MDAKLDTKQIAACSYDLAKLVDQYGAQVVLASLADAAVCAADFIAGSNMPAAGRAYGVAGDHLRAAAKNIAEGDAARPAAEEWADLGAALSVLSDSIDAD